MEIGCSIIVLVDYYYFIFDSAFYFNLLDEPNASKSFSWYKIILRLMIEHINISQPPVIYQPRKQFHYLFHSYLWISLSASQGLHAFS